MKTDIAASADLCVKCGLCLQHCPTYNLTLNENESPRGRIALIQAWAQQQLPGSKRLFAHIDHCLLCRACERVCPAEVPYGWLVDRFRAQTQAEKLAIGVKPGLTHRLLTQLTSSPTLVKLASNGIALYRRSGLQTLTRFVRLPQLLGLNKWERLLQAKPIALKRYDFEAIGEVKGHVALFKGCMTELLDGETLHSALRLLTHAGYRVSVPADQGCCGALDAHAGDQQRAEGSALNNIQVFTAQPYDAVISFASGCGSHLQEYPAPAFTQKVVDISQFLAQCGGLTAEFEALPETVVVHSPCTLKNVMRAGQWVKPLLSKIPRIRLVALPDAAQCCGSAGSYMLQYPKIAETLANHLIAQILPEHPAYVATSNIGCTLHLRAALKAQGSAIEVLHPVVLLARQLRQRDMP